MPGTPDRFPGVREDEGVLLEDVGVDPTQVGEIRLNGSDLKAMDGTGVFNLRSGSGITASQHKNLRQLIHLADGEGPFEGFASGAYKETLPSGNPLPTSEIWWESAAKLKKIVSLDTTWTGAKITQEIWKVYDTDGSTVLATVTDVISYTGVFETSRTRTVV